MDKSRIVHAEWTYRIVNTDIPETTKISLLCFPSDIGILSSFHDSIFCTRIDISIHSAISFCESEDTFMSFVGHHTTFYASHRRGGLGLYFLEIWYWVHWLSSIRKWDSTFEFIGHRDDFSVFITTFCSRRLIFEEVTLCCFFEDEFSCSSDFYTFFCTRVGLEFHGIVS